MFCVVVLMIRCSQTLQSAGGVIFAVLLRRNRRIFSVNPSGRGYALFWSQNVYRNAFLDQHLGAQRKSCSCTMRRLRA